jgi:hypothetical protein
MVLNLNRWSLIFLAAFLLQACGGSDDSDDSDGTNDDGGNTSSSLDYNGETKQAILTTQNIDEIAVAAASGIKQAASTADLPVISQRTLSPLSRDQLIDELAVLIIDVVQDGSNQQAARSNSAARTEDRSSSNCDSGSVVVDYPDSDNAEDWRIVFDQCRKNPGTGTNNHAITYNGVVEASYSQTYVREDGYHLYFRYVDFNISVDSPLANYNDTVTMTVSCYGYDAEGTDIHCDYSSDYRGYDNRNYRVDVYGISGNAISGYSVSVWVYDPDYGYVSVSTHVPVTFECSGGYPSAGRIQVNEINGTSATVEFISCSQYVVTFEGVAEIHDWH